MKRQPRPALPFALLVLLIAVSPRVSGEASGSRHAGEILGVHPGERTVTLRVSRAEGKELVVFHVPPRTPITRQDSGKALSLEDLRPGMKAEVASRREEGRRIAVEIRVRGGGRERGD